MNTQTQVPQQDMKSKTQRQAAPSDEKRLPVYLAALSLEHATTWTERDVLEWICTGLIKHQELFREHLIEGVTDNSDAADLAQILAVSEAVAYDAGQNTDLDTVLRGDFSPLQELAAEKRILAAQGPEAEEQRKQEKYTQNLWS